MIILATLGWLIVLLFTVKMFLSAYGITVLTLGFAGKWEPLALIPLFLGFAGAFVLYTMFPFDISVALK